MKKIIYFYLPLCPFCHEADQYFKESINENARFKELEIIRINEAKEVKVANSYDYYYVPCFGLTNKNSRRTSNKSKNQRNLVNGT